MRIMKNIPCYHSGQMILSNFFKHIKNYWCLGLDFKIVPFINLCTSDFR